MNVRMSITFFQKLNPDKAREFLSEKLKRLNLVQDIEFSHRIVSVDPCEEEVVFRFHTHAKQLELEKALKGEFRGYFFKISTDERYLESEMVSLDQIIHSYEKMNKKCDKGMVECDIGER